MNHRTLWIAMAALALAAGCGNKEEQIVEAKPEFGNAVVVWVDDVGLTGNQVQFEILRLASQLPKDLSEDDLEGQRVRLINQAVENLVQRQLLRREMEQSGILISQADIDQAKAEIESKLGSGQSLVTFLAAANQSMQDFEANLRLDLFKNMVLEDRMSEAEASVTEQAVRDYYDEKPLEFTLRAGRLVSHVLLRLPPDADEALVNQRQEEIEKIREKLLAGADFEAMAAEVSECRSRVNGGHLGLVVPETEPKLFADAVFGQEIGEIGDVVRTPLGLHIIKVNEEHDQKLLPFDDVKAHLTLMLKTQARQRVTKDYIDELREQAIIKLDGPLASVPEVSQEEAEEEAPE